MNFFVLFTFRWRLTTFPIGNWRFCCIQKCLNPTGRNRTSNSLAVCMSISKLMQTFWQFIYVFKQWQWEHWESRRKRKIHRNLRPVSNASTHSFHCVRNLWECLKRYGVCAAWHFGICTLTNFDCICNTSDRFTHKLKITCLHTQTHKKPIRINVNKKFVCWLRSLNLLNL